MFCQFRLLLCLARSDTSSHSDSPRQQQAAPHAVQSHQNALYRTLLLSLAMHIWPTCCARCRRCLPSWLRDASTKVRASVCPHLGQYTILGPFRRHTVPHTAPPTGSLYTYRSAAAAVPQVAGDLVSKKEDLHMAVVDLFKPRVSQVLAVVRFVRRASDAIVAAIASAAPAKHTVVPSELRHQLLLLCGAVVSLEVLKQTKSSVINELSAFRKCVPCVNVLLCL